jgi:hypothetical protein
MIDHKRQRAGEWDLRKCTGRIKMERDGQCCRLGEWEIINGGHGREVKT